MTRRSSRAWVNRARSEGSNLRSTALSARGYTAQSCGFKRGLSVVSPHEGDAVFVLTIGPRLSRFRPRAGRPNEAWKMYQVGCHRSLAGGERWIADRHPPRLPRRPCVGVNRRGGRWSPPSSFHLNDWHPVVPIGRRISVVPPARLRPFFPHVRWSSTKI
jgi:hypothetical protein